MEKYNLRLFNYETELLAFPLCLNFPSKYFDSKITNL